MGKAWQQLLLGSKMMARDNNASLPGSKWQYNSRLREIVMHSIMALAANDDVLERICSSTGDTISPWLRSSEVSHDFVPKVGEMVSKVNWQRKAAPGRELLLDAVVHGQRVMGISSWCQRQVLDQDIGGALLLFGWTAW